MLFEKIKTAGLSHLSYLIGAGGMAAVIDPRRDCDIYVERARNEGLRITHIFETHRNDPIPVAWQITSKIDGTTSIALTMLMSLANSRSMRPY